MDGQSLEHPAPSSLQPLEWNPPVTSFADFLSPMKTLANQQMAQKPRKPNAHAAFSPFEFSE